MRGEEHERPAVQRPRHIPDQTRYVLDEAILTGEHDVDGQHEKRLTLVIEGRAHRERVGDIGDAEAVEGEVERTRDGQSRRGEDDRTMRIHQGSADHTAQVALRDVQRKCAVVVAVQPHDVARARIV
jgi:hypothetical protein